MIMQSEVRDQLIRYLQRELPLAQFEGWLTQRSWNMHLDSADEVQDLVANIELSLFEHSGGYLSEDELRSDLNIVANTITDSVMVAPSGAALPLAAFAQRVQPKSAVSSRPLEVSLGSLAPA